MRRRITQAAGSPAVLPDLALQLGAPGDGGGVAYAIQFGIADQVAELTEFGQDRRCFRVGGRAHRPDPERLRTGTFQPGEHQGRRPAVQRQPQAGRGQIRAEGGRSGLQVDAAEPGPVGMHRRQARPQLGQRRPRPLFQLGQLGGDQPPQQDDVQRHRQPAAAHHRDPPFRLAGTSGREQRTGRDQLGQVRVVAQSAVAQLCGEPQRLGRDGRRAAW